MARHSTLWLTHKPLNLWQVLQVASCEPGVLPLALLGAGATLDMAPALRGAPHRPPPSAFTSAVLPDDVVPSGGVGMASLWSDNAKRALFYQ